MSDPKDTPNKPKLFEREGKPNKPADEPKQPKEPTDKPELFPRDPENPPAEEPTPTPPGEDQQFIIEPEPYAPEIIYDEGMEGGEGDTMLT